MSLAGAVYKIVANSVTSLPGQLGLLTVELIVYPTAISNGVMQFRSSWPVEKIQLINCSGQLVFEKAMNGAAGTVSLSLPVLATGIYVVQFVGDEKVERKKVLLSH